MANPMRILAADDERFQLERLVETITEACPDAEIHSFRRPQLMLDYLQSEGRETSFDLAFLDNNMGAMTGLQLAKRLKELRPDLGIMFVSGLQEFQLTPGLGRTAGFIMKPVTTERLRSEIDSYLREGLPMHRRDERNVQIRCFGEFAVMNSQGEAISFRDSRAMEILARIVLAGEEGINVKDAVRILYGSQSQGLMKELTVRKIFADMKKDLMRSGIQDIFREEKGYVSIRSSEVDCDYYRFLEMDPSAVKAWRGEFMTQYSWAEFSL